MIERVGVGHAAVMAAIHASAFPADDAWGEAAFAALLAIPGTFGLIDPDGGLILVRAAGEEAEVLTLAVAAAQQRRGWAAALVEQACEVLAGDGVGTLFLEVSETNAPARALYARCGFVEIARRRAYYAPDNDALVLKRGLS